MAGIELAFTSLGVVTDPVVGVITVTIYRGLFL